MLAPLPGVLVQGKAVLYDTASVHCIQKGPFALSDDDAARFLDALTRGMFTQLRHINVVS